jgi:hypothetical protein
MRGDGQNQLKTSVHLPLRVICRFIPFSAKSISLDSPFKYDYYTICFSITTYIIFTAKKILLQDSNLKRLGSMCVRSSCTN